MHVKDWHKFQHYKERNPPWIKLHKSLLDDPDWHDLDPTTAKALVMIWLIASESDGELPDERKLAFRLRLSVKNTVALLAQLSHWLVHDASKTLATCTPETETETETETELRAPARRRRTQIPDDFTPKAETASSAGLSQSEEARELVKFRNHAKQSARVCADWDAAWENWCIKAIEFMGRSPPQKTKSVVESGFYAAFGSPQLEAWSAHERSIGKSSPRDKSGGWRYPTEWPPGHERNAA